MTLRLDKKARARLIAAIVGLTGLLDVASSVISIGRLESLLQVLPPAVTLGSRALTLLAGFFLISVAYNLAKRKKVAWLVAIMLLSITTVTNLLTDLNIEETAIALALIGALWYTRRDFTVRSDPRALERLLFEAPYAILFFTLYSILGFYVIHNELQPNFELASVATEILNLATLQGAKLYTPLTIRAQWFLESITLISGISILYLANSITHYMLQPRPETQHHREVASQIIHTFGSNSLAYFTLSKDKTYFLNPNETSLIAYVLKNRVALAVGDPIGPPEETQPTIKAFRKLCEENDWVPAFHRVGENTLPSYIEEGFKTLKVGEEALVDIQTFDTKGSAKSDLREAMNRSKREGWQFLFFDHTIDDQNLIARMQEISDEWLQGKFGGEYGFTMGSTPLDGSDETLVSVAADSKGKAQAFLTLAPMYGIKGWVGDNLRRSKDAPPGISDYLVVSTIFKLRERGDTVLSLGLAPLANVTETPTGRLSPERILELIYERVNSVYRFKSLHEFKKKFDPRWENRYLTYPNSPSLPRIIYAFLGVHTPNFSIAELEKLIRKPFNELKKDLTQFEPSRQP